VLALEEGLREILRKLGPLCCGEHAFEFCRTDTRLRHPETVHGTRPHDRIANRNKVLRQVLGFMVLDQRTRVYQELREILVKETGSKNQRGHSLM